MRLVVGRWDWTTKSMSEFFPADRKLEKIEGGYLEKDNNAGNANFGITLAWMQEAWNKNKTDELLRQAIGFAEAPTPDTIKNLDPVLARKIRHRFWWEKFNCWKISDQRLATALYVCIFNTLRSMLVFRAALRECGANLPTGLVFRPEVMERTYQAANDLSLVYRRRPGTRLEEVFHGALGAVEAFKDHMRAHYKELAESNPDLYGDDLKGWLNRVDQL